MALYPGFLRPTLLVNRYRIGAALLLGTTFSFALGGLFYCSRETFRILSGVNGSQFLITLTPEENFCYTLFYGSIAAIFGFYVFAKVALESLVYPQNPRQRLRLRQLLNDQSFVSLTFLSGFGRLTSLIGILFLAMPMQSAINFQNEFPVLLVLLPIVLYLNGWPLIFKTFGRKSYRWFLFATLYVTALSLLIAVLTAVDLEATDEVMGLDTL